MTFIVLGLAWLTFNLLFAGLSALLAKRWGRDPFGWVLVGAVLGPFAFLTLLALRRDDIRRSRSAFTSGTDASGGLSILLAVDGSAPSQRAVEWVIKRLQASVGSVTVTTVLPLERENAVSQSEGSVQRQFLETEIAANTESATTALTEVGIPFRLVTRFGDPGKEIVALAEADGYDMVVLGRKGRGGVAKLLLGSVSERVLKEVAQPVMVVD